MDDDSDMEITASDCRALKASRQILNWILYGENYGVVDIVVAMFL